MTFVSSCYALVVSSIIILILFTYIIPFYLLKNSGTKNFIIYKIYITILTFVVLFCIPINCIIPDRTKEEKEYMDENVVYEGTWTYIFRPLYDSNGVDDGFIKKQWKNVYEFLPSSKLITEPSFYYKSNEEKFREAKTNKSRNLFDYLAWSLCMAAQWENIEFMETYHGMIDSVPEVKNLNEKDLSYYQEVCRVPGHFDFLKIKSELKVINKQLEKYNMYYFDIHSGNVMINKDGDVKFIDGEMVNKANFIIGQLIFTCIIRCPFVELDNNNRIFWSNEHLTRTPIIDSLDHRGVLVKSPIS